MNILSNIKKTWNAFLNKDPTNVLEYTSGYSYYRRPDRPLFSKGNEKTIANSVFNRIAIDVSSVSIKHVRLDDNFRYKEDEKSDLNECLTVEANLDQTATAFFQDVVISMFDEGVVAVVPVETSYDPYRSSYDICSLRTGKILQWYPKAVKVQLYDERTGKKEELILPKKMVAIIENPFYSVMNEPNSTLQRLIRKLSLLDNVDEQSSAGKLDLIIQLPYLIKTDARKAQAENRRKEIEDQLAGSKYGIAYTDGTEKITQLNRPLENNLMSQIQYLTDMFYSQLGITMEIMNGTADEKAMTNYNERTIKPILLAIVNEMRRKFLTKTARSQKQSIEFFIDPFRLVTVNNVSEIADKFTRNEIMSSNEIRQIVGLKPSTDPSADELRNKNLNQSNEEMKVDLNEKVEEGGNLQNGL